MKWLRKRELAAFRKGVMFGKAIALKEMTKGDK